MVSGATVGPSARWHRSLTASEASVSASTCTTSSQPAPDADLAIATSASARAAPAGDATIGSVVAISSARIPSARRISSAARNPFNTIAPSSAGSRASSRSDPSSSQLHRR